MRTGQPSLRSNTCKYLDVTARLSRFFSRRGRRGCGASATRDSNCRNHRKLHCQIRIAGFPGFLAPGSGRCDFRNLLKLTPRAVGAPIKQCQAAAGAAAPAARCGRPRGRSLPWRDAGNIQKGPRRAGPPPVQFPSRTVETTEGGVDFPIDMDVTDVRPLPDLSQPSGADAPPVDYQPRRADRPLPVRYMPQLDALRRWRCLPSGSSTGGSKTCPACATSRGASSASGSSSSSPASSSPASFSAPAKASNAPVRRARPAASAGCTQLLRPPLPPHSTDLLHHALRHRLRPALPRHAEGLLVAPGLRDELPRRP